VNRRAWAAACALVAIVVTVSLPYLPRGTDLYVHVLWQWQVMRCLHTGSLPLWLPDLNAGFGSPGIGLYSPLAPTICGALGLVLGTGGRGVRAALALAIIVIVAIAPGRDRRERALTAAAVLLSPAVLIEFFGRFPVAQLLSVPLAWVLLERAADHRWRYHREGILLALLWLVHAPTTVMVGIMAVAAIPFAGGEDSFGLRRHEADPAGRARRQAVQGLVMSGVVAAGLSAWHWMPLLGAAGDFPLRAALTGGEHSPLRNLIGTPSPHLWDINTAMGWAALGLLVALLVSGGWRTGRGRLAVLAVFLASVPSAFLWRVPSPMIWLQFPWRWMLPAVLLAVPVIVAEGRLRGRLRLVAALAALLVPLAAIPRPELAADPALRVDTEPARAGALVAAAFSGNPLLVDVKEHRPLWWKELGPTMGLLGSRRCVLLPGGGSSKINLWRPLRRQITVEAPHASTLVLRLLADRHWWATVDDRPTETRRWGAALAVHVPEGRSEIEIRWQTEPAAIAGAILAVGLIGIVTILRRRSATDRKLQRGVRSGQTDAVQDDDAV
jgi:hypothetical protein